MSASFAFFLYSISPSIRHLRRQMIHLYQFFFIFFAVSWADRLLTIPFSFSASSASVATPRRQADINDDVYDIEISFPAKSDPVTDIKRPKDRLLAALPFAYDQDGPGHLVRRVLRRVLHRPPVDFAVQQRHLRAVPEWNLPDESREMASQQCPAGFTTTRSGSATAEEYVELKSPPGSSFSKENTCVLCPVGTYQPDAQLLALPVGFHHKSGQRRSQVGMLQSLQSRQQ